MAKKRIGKLKIDWFNMRLEFSPNITVISKKSQSITGGDDIEEVILEFEIFSDKIQPGDPVYQTYVLGTDAIEQDEPFDLDEPWYKVISGDAPVVKKKEAPKPTPAPEPTTAPAPAPAPAPEPAKTESPEDLKQILALEQQIGSIQKMVQNLDANFSSGSIDQEAYLKKKNFLAEKMGTLMGQLDQIRS